VTKPSLLKIYTFIIDEILGGVMIRLAISHIRFGIIVQKVIGPIRLLGLLWGVVSVTNKKMIMINSHIAKNRKIA
jgi:hypothetical protein